MIDVQAYRLELHKLYGDPTHPRATLNLNATITCTSNEQVTHTMLCYLDEAAGLPFIEGYMIEVEIAATSIHADLNVRMAAKGDDIPMLEQVANYISQNKHRHYD